MKKIPVLIIVVLFINISLKSQSVSDYDGNVYQALKIGEQIWMKENLKSLHYSDGSTINEVFAYNNSEDTASVYGRLYTWEAAMKGASGSNSVPSGVQGVCPSKWHLPSAGEWEILTDFLGGSWAAGGKLKEADTIHWNAPNTGATNESGFSALPGGNYDIKFDYSSLLGNTGFWRSTTIETHELTSYYMSFIMGNQVESAGLMGFGIGDGSSNAESIRCIKDNNFTALDNKILPQLNVYPNPAREHFTIECPYKINIIEISDLNGRLVYRQIVNNNTVNVAGINKGIYILKAETDKKSFIRRIAVISD